jgi:hypothetical protein
MYLAPLNYDRFFKKVFSDTSISKRFLEDFLDISIEDIQPLDKQKNLTDDSRLVEFDFRCRINGNDIIVDMQQWYKQDVIQRFYTYHTLSTGLQLEDLPYKSIIINDETNQIKEIKDYRALNPVLTLIWMVDDTLSFENNFVSYIMLPEATLHFIQHKEIWSNKNMVEILKEHKKILKMINNTTRELDFLPRNRLIFMFQKNIIKDKKKLEKYHRWFRFAGKTRNENNKPDDFKEFTGDPVFAEMIRRLTVAVLSDEDIKYITDQKEFLEKTKRFEDGWFEIGKIAGMHQSKMIIEEKEKTIEEKEKTIEEKEKTIEEKEKTIEEKEKTIEEKEKTIEEKEKALMAEKKRTDELKKQADENELQITNIVMNLQKKGYSLTQITDFTGFDATKIQKIIGAFHK